MASIQQLPALGVWLGKAQSWVLCLLVLGSLAAPAVVQVAGMSSDPSFIDNRPPAPFPAFPRSGRELRKFRDGVTRFAGDNFGLRAELVKLNVLLHHWIGVSSIPAVVVGKNGWVFLKGDFAVFDQFRARDRFTDGGLDAWIDTMEMYRQWLAARGVAFMVVVVPNQQTVYPEYMPGYANRVFPETRLDQVARRLRERDSNLEFVDLRSAMWAARKDGLLYHQYENHWNALGAFVGYAAMMREVKKRFPGVVPLQLSDFTAGTARTSWSIPPKTEVEPTLTLRKPSAIVGTETVGAVQHVKFEKSLTGLEAAPSVLFYGDSFGDIGLLSNVRETFRWTINVATNWAPFPSELVRVHRPDLVIYQLVERYLARPLGHDAEMETDVLIAAAPPLAVVARGADGSPGGSVDGVRLDGDRIYFSGRVVDKCGRALGARVYAYLGDRVVGAGTPSLGQPGGPPGVAGREAGFQVGVRRGAGFGANGHRLRFFAVHPDGPASELRVTSSLLPMLEEALKPGLAR